MATAHLRSRVRWSLAVLVVVMLALSLTSRPALAPASESATVGELLRVATQFNHEYQVGDLRPVWERFDAASRAIIPESRYLRWHGECRAAPGAATTLGATRASRGWWIVAYSIGGVRLGDYWHREHGRWRFSLRRSNPLAATLYASSFAQYAHATGCR